MIMVDYVPAYTPTSQQVWGRYIRPWALAVGNAAFWSGWFVPDWLWLHLLLVFVGFVAMALWWRGRVIHRRTVIQVPRWLDKRVDRAEAAWRSLPPDLRASTQPVLVATYHAATMSGPDQEVKEAVLARVDLLEGFAKEAKLAAYESQRTALGRDDLEAGQRALEALRELRNVGQPKELP